MAFNFELKLKMVFGHAVWRHPASIKQTMRSVFIAVKMWNVMLWVLVPCDLVDG
jgi:hypothetical protein